MGHFIQGGDEAVKRQRDKWSGVVACEAICDVCGWQSGAKNSLPNAARHYDATGHTVRVEIVTSVCYCSPEESERKRKEKEAAL